MVPLSYDLAKERMADRLREQNGTGSSCKPRRQRAKSAKRAARPLQRAAGSSGGSGPRGGDAGVEPVGFSIDALTQGGIDVAIIGGRRK